MKNLEEGMQSKKSDLIVAMDKMPLELDPEKQYLKGELGVRELIKKIGAEGSAELMDRVVYKINDLLAEIGMRGVKEFVDSLEKEGFDTSKINWMFDPKWNDIPNTVENYFEKLNSSNIQNVRYVTIMAAGGEEMMRKAVERRNKLGMKTKILAVTVLTSMNDEQSRTTFNETVKHQVLKFAKSALESGVDGIVCSPLESEMLKEVFGDKYIFETVTPGIRPTNAVVSGDDQKRTRTPADAIKGGSNHLVMGRPIIQSENPIKTLEEVLADMDGSKYEKGEPKFTFERILYTGSWEQLIKYIGAIYNRPEGGKYVRLASKLISDGYINIGATERNFRVLERAGDELAGEIRKDHKKLIQELKMGMEEQKNILVAHYEESLEELKSGVGLSESEKDQYIINLKEAHEDKLSELEFIMNGTINSITKIDVVMGAQMGSVRLSSFLAKSLGIEESIYTEKKGDEMILKRHDVDLKGKNVILSEDVITMGSTLDKMIKLVEDAGGKVVGITCVVNRSGSDNYKGIPIKCCHVPEKFGMFYDKESVIGGLGKILSDKNFPKEYINNVQGILRSKIYEGVELRIKDNLLAIIKKEGFYLDFAELIDDLFDTFKKAEMFEEGVVEDEPKANWDPLVKSMVI